MKGLRKILARPFLLLTFLLCFIINSYVGYASRDINNNISAAIPIENCINSYDDSVNEDQINSPEKPDFTVTAFCKTLISQNCILVCNYPDSIWQPPKIS
jgi:hypothetical protein